MIAVMSATEHDYYAMPLPFAAFSWEQMGIDCIVFIPEGDNPKLNLAKKYCLSSHFITFSAEEKRIPTYSQVSRLFAAANDFRLFTEDEVYITSDSDMCVFGDYFHNLPAKQINVVGADLTPEDQYPMCYISMPASKWRKVFNITKSSQAHVSELIDPIEGLNIRGEQWSYDQWYAKKKLDESGEMVLSHPRSNGKNQFATKRADRDGWHFDPYNIIDAHLPRPLTEQENFNKVYELFKIKYPHEDLQWMIDYRNEYLQL